MKKLMIIAVALLALSISVVHADNKRPVGVEQLPQKVQQFIKQHFSSEEVAYALLDRGFLETRYDVTFISGIKLEFSKDGEWREVDCKYAPVPAVLVPSKIAEFVTKNYPDVAIVQIDRDQRDYEIKLSNGLELTFDLKFNLIKIDD